MPPIDVKKSFLLGFFFTYIILVPLVAMAGEIGRRCGVGSFDYPVSGFLIITGRLICIRSRRIPEPSKPVEPHYRSIPNSTINRPSNPMAITGRTVSPVGSAEPRRPWRCRDVGSWERAQQLLREGHAYLDRDGDGEACEVLR